MKRRTARLVTVGACSAIFVGLTAATHLKSLAATSPGLWEISGLPGNAAPVRQCLADPAELAKVEHRGQACTQTVISDQGSSAVIQYNCASRGFGQSKLTVITPRSLRVETQGISAGYPFNYVVQARRAGNCPGH